MESTWACKVSTFCCRCHVAHNWKASTVIQVAVTVSSSDQPRQFGSRRHGPSGRPDLRPARSGTAASSASLTFPSIRTAYTSPFVPTLAMLQALPQCTIIQRTAESNLWILGGKFESPKKQVTKIVFEIQLFCGEAFTWRQLLGLGPRLRGILCTFCLEKKKMLRLGFRSVRQTESKCFNFGRGPERSVRLGGRPGDLWALKSTGSTLKKPSKHFSGNAVNTTLFFVCVRQCLLRYFLLFKNLLAFRDAVKVELLNISLD